MNKTPVEPLVVSFACLVLVNISAQPCAGANSTSGGSTFTALDAANALQEAFSLGSGRPMPAMEFGGVPIGSPACTHPRPGRHDSPGTPPKIKPAYEFPISHEQHSELKPPHMTGVSESQSQGPIPHLQNFLQGGQNDGWSPSRLHMPAPSQQQVKNALESAARVKPLTPQVVQRSIQSRAQQASSADGKARDRTDAVRSRIRQILTERRNNNK